MVSNVTPAAKTLAAGTIGGINAELLTPWMREVTHAAGVGIRLAF